jgi:hypothetical protein
MLESRRDLAREFAAIAAAVRDDAIREAAQPGPAAMLHAAVLAVLARLITALAALVAAWQDGTLPAQPARRHRPARTPHPRAARRTARVRRPRARRAAPRDACRRTPKLRPQQFAPQPRPHPTPPPGPPLPRGHPPPPPRRKTPAFLRAPRHVDFVTISNYLAGVFSSRRTSSTQYATP